jgi:hypothetical protein
LHVLAPIVGLAGLAGIYLRLRREFPHGVTFLTVALIGAATPLAWYTVLEPSLPEVAAFAVAAWCGVAALGPLRADERFTPTMVFGWIGLCAIPPLIIWWRTLAGAGFVPSLSQSVEVLFSSRRGFLSWTPAVYLAVAGTVFYLRHRRDWAFAALASVMFAAWLVGSSETWQAEPVSATRPLIALLPFLGPGLACLLELLRRRPVLALVPLVALPLIWNYLLMVQYTIGLLPKDEPISFARMVRQQADLQVRTMPLYPFSFPANLWFSWREGVPVDRYDSLGMEPLVRSLNLALDRTAARFLLGGWSGPTAEGEGQGWWIGDREASIVLPLDISSPHGARLTIVARSRFEEPIVVADLLVRVNGHDVGTFSPAATQASEAQFVVPAAALRKGLNQVALVSQGIRREDSSDMRPPGPLARHPPRAWPVAVYRIAVTEF